MKYNREIHNRRSIRLHQYDYSQAGAYFVTLCVKDRACLFGDVIDGKMQLNDAGRVADEFMIGIPGRYPNIIVDCHQIMPNHVHAVLVIVDSAEMALVGAIHELPLREHSESEQRRLKRRTMLIPKCMGFYRMNTAKRINVMRGMPGIPVWQRNYHEHIIRNQQSLDRIRRYIAENPENWTLDRNYPLPSNMEARGARTPGV